MAKKMNVWERIYQHGEQLNIVPYTEPLSFLSRQWKGKFATKVILEIGCGAGNNLLFCQNQGASVHGIDISPTAIKICQKRGLFFVKTGDIKKIEYPPNTFDAVIDRACIQQNKVADIKKILSEVYRVLKSGGLFYSSVTAFNHHLCGIGKKVKGEHTYINPNDGTRHFFTPQEVTELYGKFKFIQFYATKKEDLLNNRSKNVIYHVECTKK